MIVKNGIYEPMLSVDDPHFNAKLLKALGVKQGDTLRIETTQFERTDGVVPVGSVDSWAMLRTLSASSLEALGCIPWDEPDEHGMVLMLFPKEWHSKVPTGYEIVDINGQREKFAPGGTDDDCRYGCLSYGIEAT